MHPEQLIRESRKRWPKCLRSNFDSGVLAAEQKTDRAAPYKRNRAKQLAWVAGYDAFCGTASDEPTFLQKGRFLVGNEIWSHTERLEKGMDVTLDRPPALPGKRDIRSRHKGVKRLKKHKALQAHVVDAMNGKRDGYIHTLGGKQHSMKDLARSLLEGKQRGDGESAIIAELLARINEIEQAVGADR